METFEEEVERLSRRLPKILVTQVLVYAIALTCFYFYSKNEIEKAIEPSLKAAAELRLQIEGNNRHLEESERNFQEKYEKRKNEHLRLIHEQGQHVLDTMEANFQDYLHESEDYFERLREIGRQLPKFEEQLDKIEKKQKEVRRDLDGILFPE